MSRIFIVIFSIVSANTGLAETLQVEVMRMACTERILSSQGADPENTLIVEQVYDPMTESGNPSFPNLDRFLEEHPNPNQLPFVSRGILSIHPGIPEDLNPEAIDAFIDQPGLETEFSVEGSINRTHRIVYQFENTEQKIRMDFDQSSLQSTFMRTGDFPTESSRLFECSEPYRVTKIIEARGSEEEVFNEETIVVN